MDKIVGQVYETYDYDMFKKLNGNRNVNQVIVNRIIRSVQKVGQVIVPVTVNENIEVIDGQNRVNAFKQLNLPVYYTIANGAGLEQCVSLNINQTPWKTKDYIESYAHLGEESYVILLDMVNKFPEFNIEFVASAILDKSAITGFSEKDKEGCYKGNTIISGAYRCTKEMAQEAAVYLEKLKAFKEVVKKLNGAQKFMYNAILFAIRHTEVNAETLLNRMNLRYAKMIPFTSTQTAVESLQGAYNFNNKRHVVYIATEYDKAMRKSNPSYRTRWSKFE